MDVKKLTHEFGFLVNCAYSVYQTFVRVALFKTWLTLAFIVLLLAMYQDVYLLTTIHLATTRSTRSPLVK